MNKMQKFLNRIKPKAKYILGILGIAAIVSQGAFAFTKIGALSPRFNFLQGDYEMFRGANRTAGENVWKDPLSGNAGDTFEAIVYYHNGVVDTTAENTRLKVNLPSHTTNNVATLSASISADNAETVTDTVVDGQVVGLSGLTVNLNQDANLTLVPDSVRWYPDQMENPNVPQALPNGQTGNEITSGSGVNIGGINGCWQYAGYVTFQFRTDVATAPALNVEKSVRNVTSNETNFVEVTNASKNNEVEFKIVADNPGTATANNVVLKDTLPAELSFVAGSMKMYRNGSTTAEIVTDANAALVFANGWNIGNLQVGNTKADTILFKAKAPSSIPVAQLVTNTARVTSGSLNDSDEAKVNLLPTHTPVIVPNKNAKNVTTGQVSAPEVIGERNVLSLDSLAGQTIEYTLITKNTGDAAAENYVIEDGISDILEYANVTSVSNGGSVVTGTTGNDAMVVRYPAVTIAAGEEVVRTFTVKVMDPLPNTPANGFHFDMQMYNKYGDEVIVKLSRPQPPVVLPILHIDKKVRNFTINELDFVDSNSAISGDTLEYIISYSNTGNAAADQVRFSDVLPANVTYISGTTVISVNGQMEHTLPDGIVGSGVMLDTIAVDETGYIKFRVITNAEIPAGTELVNTGNLTDNGVTISDTAKTTFKAPVVLTVAPKPLPRTGANSVAVAVIGAILVAGATMLVVRRFA